MPYNWFWLLVETVSLWYKDFSLHGCKDGLFINWDVKPTGDPSAARASLDIQTHFKSLLCHIWCFIWLKPSPWPNPVSQDGEIDSTFWWKAWESQIVKRKARSEIPLKPFLRTSFLFECKSNTMKNFKQRSDMIWLLFLKGRSGLVLRIDYTVARETSKEAILVTQTR